MKCAKCNMAVIVYNGEIIRACNCKKPDGTPMTVIADCTGATKGKGGVRV